MIKERKKTFEDNKNEMLMKEREKNSVTYIVEGKCEQAPKDRQR